MPSIKLTKNNKNYLYQCQAISWPPCYESSHFN